jgi:hypothetical protein
MTQARPRRQNGKTSVYIPPDLLAVAKEHGLSPSKIAQHAVFEHLTWALTPGPERAREVTGSALAEVVALMAEAELPLSATLQVRQEHGMDKPGVFLVWRDILPAPEQSYEFTDDLAASSDGDLPADWVA